jgi:hypothetical protein
MNGGAGQTTAIPRGCLIVAVIAVAANWPETVFDLTTRQVDALEGDESAGATKDSCPDCDSGGDGQQGSASRWPKRTRRVNR